MPRALPGVVGVLLALTVVVPAPKASAQILSRFRRQQTPVQKGRYEIDAILSDEHQRLAEMKVELALLSDIATFPYEFAARANGKTLELRGNVPNEMIRQRAIDLARSNTFLRGIDGLRIQPNLSVRSTLRPPNVLQQEGIELLHKELGAPARLMSLGASPNGVVVLRGPIDCVEGKLEISRLFRRLPGCTAVINELTVEPILLDGQRMVRVTHNNMLLVPPSALGQGAEPLPASSGASSPEMRTPPAVERQPASSPPQAVPSPVPARTSSLNAHEGELSLPTAVALKQSNKSGKVAAEKVGGDWASFAPSKLPVKWGHPTQSWEAQAKALDPANSPSESSTPGPARQQAATPQPPPNPAKPAWAPQAPARPGVKQLVLDPTLSRPAETIWTRSLPAQSAPRQANNSSRSDPAAKKEASEPVMTWRRPGSSEEAEPKPAPTSTEPRKSASSREKPVADSHGPEKSAPSAGPSLRSSRRWPPAYVAGTAPRETATPPRETATPPSEGKSGVIAFDDDPPPAKPASAVIATSPSLAPADLQRRIKSLCGRQAHEVVAAVQKDGIVLVRVKVANRSIEDQLSRKILTLPEMSSPRVRLMMEVEP